MGKKMTRKQKRKQMKLTNKKETSKMKNFTTTTKTTWKPPAPPCHTGQNKIFTTTSGIDVYGGGRNRNGGWWMCSPMVDLAIGPDETMRPLSKSILNGGTTVPTGWSCDQFVGRTDPPKHIIEMDFPDFGVPQLEDYFWYALCDDITEHGIKSISTQCAGGHGRTGVQLCILYYLLNDDDVKSSIIDAAQLIELIRDLHCHHAVETTEQQQYIARVLDIPAGKTVIEDRYSYGGGWGKASGVSKTPTGKTAYTDIDVNWDDLYDEKYVMQDDDDDDDLCECCGKTALSKHTDVCNHCGWTTPKTDTQLCFTCGKELTIDSFSHETDAECMTCHARHHDIKYDMCGVFCDGCKKIRYFDFISHKTSDDKFMCLKCDADEEVIE